VLRGHKIGLTSAPMQELLGVNEPDFGYILDSMVLPNGAAVPVTAFCAPRVEPEAAFLMRAPLRGPGVTAEDVMAATEALAPALEIVDSRIANWRITLADTIADNASSAAVVLGECQANRRTMARRSRRQTMRIAASVSPPAAKSMRMAEFTSVTLFLTR
jgi:2-keto-4-pentenoate hydratase